MLASFSGIGSSPVASLSSGFNNIGVRSAGDTSNCCNWNVINKGNLSPNHIKMSLSERLGRSEIRSNFHDRLIWHLSIKSCNPARQQWELFKLGVIQKYTGKYPTVPKFNNTLSFLSIDSADHLGNCCLTMTSGYLK